MELQTAPKNSGRSRFIKSFKYKHKFAYNYTETLLDTTSQLDCDRKPMFTRRPNSDCAKALRLHGFVCRLAFAMQAQILSLLLLLLLASSAPVGAFCPFKCHCDDLQLSANCTRAPSLTIVPMTLNPLLKRLTLNQLQISELSNSLSIYRQLEYLNLNSNQLRQLRYANFNFKAAPPHVWLPSLAQAGDSGYHHHQQEQLELLARAMRVSLERSLAPVTTDHQALASSDASGRTSGGEATFALNLRQLHLSENKIEQLGELSAPITELNDNEQQAEQQPTISRRRLKAHQLELAAPFLSLTKLELLDLSGNKLARLDEHAFLGLLSLRSLDLSRNELQTLDKHSLVGLVELRQLRLNNNKLLSRHHFAHLGLTMCRAPLGQLQQLDLSDNENLPTIVDNNGSGLQPSETRARHVLHKQMFECTPKLERLQLSALQLRHIQAQTLDSLVSLRALNLSSNPLEQVPSDLLAAHQNQQQQQQQNGLLESLSELDLSNTLIEFVSLKSSNSLGALKALSELHMSQMPRLVSFDLAALAQQDVATRAPLNERLERLYLANNRRLQWVHSSLSGMHFARLSLIDLRGSIELRELAEPRSLAELSQVGLQLELAHSTQLNCSSCQLAWLVELARAQLGQQAQQSQLLHHNHHHQATPMVPFDPYNSFAHPQRATGWPPQEQSNTGGQVHLVQPELIGCAWPFQMALVELLSLELGVNYAPLLARKEQCVDVQAAQQDAPQLANGALFGFTVPLVAPREPRNELLAPGQRRDTDFTRPSATPPETGGAAKAPQVGSLELAVLALASLALLFAGRLGLRHLRAASGRRAQTTKDEPWSPSSTASSAIGSSPSSSTSSAAQVGVARVVHLYEPTTGGHNSTLAAVGERMKNFHQHSMDRTRVYRAPGGNLFSRLGARLSGGGGARGARGARCRALFSSPQAAARAPTTHHSTGGWRGSRADGCVPIARAACTLKAHSNRTTRVVLGAGCQFESPIAGGQSGAPKASHRQRGQLEQGDHYNICGEQPAAPVYDSLVECAQNNRSDSRASLIYANCQQQQRQQQQACNQVAAPLHQIPAWRAQLAAGSLLACAQLARAEPEPIDSARRMQAPLPAGSLAPGELLAAATSAANEQRRAQEAERKWRRARHRQPASQLEAIACDGGGGRESDSANESAALGTCGGGGAGDCCGGQSGGRAPNQFGARKERAQIEPRAKHQQQSQQSPTSDKATSEQEEAAAARHLRESIYVTLDKPIRQRALPADLVSGASGCGQQLEQAAGEFKLATGADKRRRSAASRGAQAADWPQSTGQIKEHTKQSEPAARPHETPGQDSEQLLRHANGRRKLGEPNDYIVINGLANAMEITGDAQLATTPTRQQSNHCGEIILLAKQNKLTTQNLIGDDGVTLGSAQHDKSAIVCNDDFAILRSSQQRDQRGAASRAAIASASKTLARTNSATTKQQIYSNRFYYCKAPDLV